MSAQQVRPTHSDSDRAIVSTRSLIHNSREYASLSPQLQEFLNDHLYGCETVDRFTPSSALLARRRSAGCLQATMQLHFNDILGPNPEPYLATFAYLAGEVPMGHTLKNTQTMISEALQALSSFELEGVLTTDIDLLLPLGCTQPIVAWHLHGVVVSTRSSKRKLRLKKTARQMDELIGLQSRLPLGANLRGKLPGSSSVHAETMAAYAGKNTSALKVESTSSNGKPKFERDRSLYTAKHAINVLYAWSQIPVLESLIPVGRFGEQLHRTWEKNLCARKAYEARSVSFGSANRVDQWQEILGAINNSSQN